MDEMMPHNPNNVSTDLRGVSSLTIDAIIGVTDIVESLHHTINGGSGVSGAPDQNRTRGIPGLVYRNIRAITRLVGGGIDLLFERLSLVLEEQDSPPAREAVLAAVNGVLGDYLVSRNNPLAIPMQPRRHGQPLNEQALAAVIEQSNGRLAIMVHGACMNDLQWQRTGHDHGAALARDLGWAPIYVHYNSGLHVSENGQKLAQLLQTIVDQTPQRLELVVIGYSMGGLVARSACHYGKISGYTWPKQLDKLLFLGTPHHGTPLEKGGNWIDAILGISPYSAPFSRLGKIRGGGFTDLRYGNVLDEDWQGRDRFKLSVDQRIPVPLPEGVHCYAIAATTAKASSKRRDDLIGDGLVPVNSALGRHEKAELTLTFPERQQWIGRSMNHLDILNHPDVYETLRKWVGSELA
ncbi:MAG: hypothetical protein GWP61_20545 [Chloroflexi bacterium]|jgi:pimeloyl-ACP methyl ester carboxylesterase|nr:hypothetical protein [Chloroflexota bacterium]